jgi:hypothetical protein
MTLTTMTAATMSRNVTRATTFRFLRLVQQQQKQQNRVQSIQHPHVVNRPLWNCLSSSRFSSSSSFYSGTADAEDSRRRSPHTDDESPIAVQWKRIIKPFLVKCHPDMAKQQGLGSSARQLNLRAIQNLNSYMNGVIAMQGGGSTTTAAAATVMKYPFDVNQRILEIDFVLALPPNKSSHNSHSKASQQQQQAHPTTSRRKVELKVPPPHASPTIVKRLVSKELMKLLNMAGLQISSSSLLMSYMEEDDYHYENEDKEEEGGGDMYNKNRRHWNQENINNGEFDKEGDDDFWGRRTTTTNRGRPFTKRKTAWERSRDAYTANIDWTKVDAAYEDAVRDMHANYATQGMIRDNPTRRRALLASILQRVQVVNEEKDHDDDDDDDTKEGQEPRSSSSSISVLDRLVTLRRLLQLLEDHFDRLQLESCGRFWEQILHIQIVGPRTYNTSTTALHRRRKRKMETGFGYTLHENNAVTITIPVDFQDSELVEELDRNVWDFYNMMHQQEYAKMGLDLDSQLH